MKLSRLRSFLDQWIISIQNYPCAHIIIIVIAVATMVSIESDYDSNILNTMIKIITSGLLVLPLTLIKTKHWITQAGVIVAGIIYYLLLPANIDDIYYAQGVWIAGSVILAWIMPSVVIAYDHRDDQYSTWTQFTHWWTSLIQGAIGGLILWGGVAASLASIEFLFGVNITSEIYMHVGVITAGCVGSRIWLINLQQQSDFDVMMYPRVMRIFGQYIFLPLCVIYGLILISYGIKIIATGIWPQGQLVYMVSGYIAFGLLTWFTLLPLQGTSTLLTLQRENPWLDTSYRVLFSSFVITSGLMIAALVLRIQQYGWTIDRGFVAALIVWIIVMGVGCVIWQGRRWMIGLASFAIIWAISIFAMPPVIKQYQIISVKQARNTLGLGNTPGENPLAPQTMYRGFNYLAQNYGTGWMNGRIQPSVIDKISDSSNRNLASDLMDAIGVTGYNSNMGTYDDPYRSFYSDQQSQSYEVGGYQRLIMVNNRDTGTTFTGVNINDNTITIQGKPETIINLGDYLSKDNQSKDNAQPITIPGDNYTLIITNANGNNDTLEGRGGYLLLK